MERITCERTQAWNAARRVFCFKQPEDMSLSDYHKEFKLRVKAAQKSGVQLYNMQHLFDAFRESEYYAVGDGMKEFSLLPAPAKEDIKERAAERLLAVGFILNASNTRFGEFKRDRVNSISRGGYNYPTTIDGARTEMEMFKPARSFRTGGRKSNGNRNNTGGGR